MQNVLLRGVIITTSSRPATTGRSSLAAGGAVSFASSLSRSRGLTPVVTGVGGSFAHPDASTTIARHRTIVFFHIVCSPLLQ